MNKNKILEALEKLNHAQTSDDPKFWIGIAVERLLEALKEEE